MSMKTISKAGVCLIILVAIYALMCSVKLFPICELSDYMCIFSELLKFSGIVLILYVASRSL